MSDLEVGPTVEAPAGTVIELLVHEAHEHGGPVLLNYHFSWTRFICKEGVNRFETFDFESLRWLQLSGVRMLCECPEVMGFSYPANAGWRLWALAKAGRADVVAEDWRRRWATLPSVLLNNTLLEAWTSPPDSSAQWSHCAVVPLYVLFMSLAGIRPLEPGFKRLEISVSPLCQINTSSGTT